jgi:hypothetical protein
VAYLNCPECFYRVRTQMARNLEGEASCPRCARLGRLVAMYSTELALRPDAEVKAPDPPGMGLGPAPSEGPLPT